MRAFGVSDPRFHDIDTSKLFGWPELIQRDLDCTWSRGGESRSQLLLQVGQYDNGAESHWWGPGGLLYFMISDADLAQRRLDRAVFEMQCS